ncbi:peroxiredoxin family protein [Pseudochryseolinea flava]|uniref:TlpA family protein disulfide reductase n=1 Tax=Pseudochryseolinea flava TaxID=2059302 RepID=A0A364XUT7_9BACT|nr:TlpA disulfide reductase family protein [Pseudochryseolinea flava]RAV97904.1 TlpA family protein disulfide reductase [Pseudochryseolinea flava]
MKSCFYCAVFALLLVGCTDNGKHADNLQTGIWRATIDIQGHELPFGLEILKDKSGSYDFVIRNADERLLLDEVSIEGDSLNATLHIFDANIKAKIDGDELRGYFVKNYDPGYKHVFKAHFGQTHRFTAEDNLNPISFAGKYAVTFLSKSDTTTSVGIFEQTGDSVTGTFLTPTGDYRFLQGDIVGDTMHLSAFDGNHAYLFTAYKTSDSTLAGEYLSGKAGHEIWTAIKNDHAKLPAAESLTFLKEGYDKIEFSFPDINGKKISLADEKYKNKVVILQMSGSWCPNCMDETKFLSPWYNENKDRGVEIIGLAYERKDDFTYASERVKKMISKMDIRYDYVIAGTNDKEKAATTLPMLNKVVAFPTTIFIGKDGKVKKIHTGFSGPGTGVYYHQFIQDFNETVNELLLEKSTSMNN